MSRASEARRAGRTIGTLRCPWCSSDEAQARQNAGRHAYCYCPACGMTTTARTGLQSELVLRAMIATPPAAQLDIETGIKPQPGAAEPPPKLQPHAAPPAAPPAPSKPRGLWEQLVS